VRFAGGLQRRPGSPATGFRALADLSTLQVGDLSEDSEDRLAEWLRRK
jgi:hypothetical protein